MRELGLRIGRKALRRPLRNLWGALGGLWAEQRREGLHPPGAWGPIGARLPQHGQHPGLHTDTQKGPEQTKDKAPHPPIPTLPGLTADLADGHLEVLADSV